MPIAPALNMLRPVCDYVGPHSLERCQITATYRLTDVKDEHGHVSHACDSHLDVAVGLAERPHVELIEATPAAVA